MFFNLWKDRRKISHYYIQDETFMIMRYAFESVWRDYHVVTTARDQFMVENDSQI